MSPIKSISAILALGLLAACSADDAVVSSDLRPVNITANVDMQMLSRANGAVSEQPTRCYVEVREAQSGNKTLFSTMQTSGDGYTLNAMLRQGVAYNIYFWADNATAVDAAAPDITALDAVTYTPGATAYSGIVALDTDDTDISCTLTHCVAKLSLRSTTDVPAGRNVTMWTSDGTYTQFNLLAGMTNDGHTAGAVAGSQQVVSASSDTQTTAGDDVITLYVLAATMTPDEAAAAGGAPSNQRQTVYVTQLSASTDLADMQASATAITEVPLQPNVHTIITGDVAALGFAQNDFTVNTESLGNAGFDESWGSQSIMTPDYDYDSSTNTYTVKTADGLFAWREAASRNRSTNCILANDIDITGRPWTSVRGSTSNAREYKGTFDGAGHTITGLSFASNSSHYSFFYQLENATVKDVNFADVNIRGGNSFAATIANDCYNSLVSNCHVTGEVVATNSRAGGLFNIVGNRSIVSDCSFNGEVSGSEYVGGIACYLTDNSTIEDCRVEADITSQYSFAGGIVCDRYCPDANDTTKIVGCSFKGSVSGDISAGGIVSSSNVQIMGGPLIPGPPIIACHSSGTVSGGNSSGGIVGEGTCVIKSCYSTAEISTTSTYHGAIAGRLISDGSWVSSIDNCFYKSNVTETNSGAKEVDGSNIKWEDAMNTMNAALTSDGYKWQYKVNTDTGTNTDEPLLLLKN